MNGHENSALTTLGLLETRLRRLTFILTGTSDIDGVPTTIPRAIGHEDTIPSKLERLKVALEKLYALEGHPGNLIRTVNDLYVRHPEVFGEGQNLPSPLSKPSTLEVSDRSSVVLSHATLYPETASRLSSLQTLQIPPAEQSQKLIDLRSRIDVCKKKQDELEVEANELRERSARCLEWWVTTGVVGMDELWEEWDSRANEADITVRRLERKANEEEGYV